MNDDKDMILMCRAIVENEQTSVEEKKQLLDEIRKFKPASENRWNMRWVIIILGFIACSAPLYFLFNHGSYLPEALMTLSSTSVGALAAFFTSNMKK